MFSITNRWFFYLILIHEPSAVALSYVRAVFWFYGFRLLCSFTPGHCFRLATLLSVSQPATHTQYWVPSRGRGDRYELYRLWSGIEPGTCIMQLRGINKLDKLDGLAKSWMSKDGRHFETGIASFEFRSSPQFVYDRNVDNLTMYRTLSRSKHWD